MKLTRNLMRGQSLIEVLVAFGVVVMVGMALITASLATQRTSISARNKSQATELAQQYLEQVRVIRDVKGFSVPVTGCRTIDYSTSSNPALWAISSGVCTGLAPADGEQVTLNNIIYYRKVNFSVITTNLSTKAVVKVDWKEGTNDRSVSNETIISKWCGGAVSVAGSPCPSP